MWQEDEMAMMDEVFDAAAYVRARCEGGDVEELAAFALCCKADATRLGNMVGRIQRKLDAVIETRDGAPAASGRAGERDRCLRARGPAE